MYSDGWDSWGMSAWKHMTAVALSPAMGSSRRSEQCDTLGFGRIGQKVGRHALLDRESASGWPHGR